MLAEAVTGGELTKVALFYTQCFPADNTNVRVR